MRRPTSDELTRTELLVLDHAGGANDLGIAYGMVQLHANFEQEVELLDATESALLRLFDLGLLRFVEAPWETGYELDRSGLPPLSREQLVAELQKEFDPNARIEKLVFYDPTPAGEAVLASVPREQIPSPTGNVRRPWLDAPEGVSDRREG